MSDPFSLAGRTALVTGASRGLGFGMARGLARAGAHVVLNGRDRALLDARCAELRAEGCSASSAAFDVRERNAAEAARHAETQAARGTGDQRGAPGEGKRI